MSQINLTLGSLFDGSGGFPLAGLQCGIVPVWASEIEPFPIRVTTKRLPNMKHYGDISAMDGGEVEPVDIITFGSPCTDVSIAGRRAGLDGQKSILFYQAIRIIKEMRTATNGRYPRYICWENVPGAFSSNQGEDFKAVLESIIGIVEPGAEVPAPEKNKWPHADVYLGDGWSLAYRTLDAQYWGVPQRRKRIFLVADFAGGSAGQVLFESEGLSGYSAESFRAWKGTAGDAETGFGASGLVLNDQGGRVMECSEDVAATLRAECHGHPPCVMSAGFCKEHSAQSRGIGYAEELAPTLRAETVPATVYENHSQDTRYTGPVTVAPTVSATYGLGGNNQPFVVDEPGPLQIPYTKGTRPHAAGDGQVWKEGIVANTLNTFDVGEQRCNELSVHSSRSGQSAYGIGRDTFNMGIKAKFSPTCSEELQPTLVAKGPGGTVTDLSVRRLTPTECARLQGFPDWWCSDLETPNPTMEDLRYWYEVFETHRRITHSSTKAKSLKQVAKWLRSPHSDSAEYKMWGNGVALPCVYFVLAGIVFYSQIEGV